MHPLQLSKSVVDTSSVEFSHARINPVEFENFESVTNVVPLDESSDEVELPPTSKSIPLMTLFSPLATREHGPLSVDDTISQLPVTIVDEVAVKKELPKVIPPVLVDDRTTSVPASGNTHNPQELLVGTNCPTLTRVKVVSS